MFLGVFSRVRDGSTLSSTSGAIWFEIRPLMPTTPLSASERKVLMVIPPGYTEALHPGARDSCLEDTRKSAVGNGFHVLSIVLLPSLRVYRQGCQATRISSFRPTASEPRAWLETHSGEGAWAPD